MQKLATSSRRIEQKVRARVERDKYPRRRLLPPFESLIGNAPFLEYKWRKCALLARTFWPGRFLTDLQRLRAFLNPHIYLAEKLANHAIESIRCKKVGWEFARAVNSWIIFFLAGEYTSKSWIQIFGLTIKNFKQIYYLAIEQKKKFSIVLNNGTHDTNNKFFSFIQSNNYNYFLVSHPLTLFSNLFQKWEW